MYNNSSALLFGSTSTRTYFISLPVWLQLLLHEQQKFIENYIYVPLILQPLIICWNSFRHICAWQPCTTKNDGPPLFGKPVIFENEKRTQHIFMHVLLLHFNWFWNLSGIAPSGKYCFYNVLRF